MWTPFWFAPCVHDRSRLVEGQDSRGHPGREVPLQRPFTKCLKKGPEVIRGEKCLYRGAFTRFQKSSGALHSRPRIRIPRISSQAAGCIGPGGPDRPKRKAVLLLAHHGGPDSLRGEQRLTCPSARPPARPPACLPDRLPACPTCPTCSTCPTCPPCRPFCAQPMAHPLRSVPKSNKAIASSRMLAPGPAKRVPSRLKLKQSVPLRRRTLEKSSNTLKI